jgi:succinate dehydrogenase / fumarate reductase cytochrome b subunit
MGQVKADASGPETQRRTRPLSPHLQVWRWHITMAASIFTRATGVALYVGLFVVVAWAVSLASGPEAYGAFMGLMASWLGRLVLFGLSVSIFYHLAAGLRHLGFDSGVGMEPKTANMTAALCMAFGVVATLVIWALAFVMGAL